MPQHFPPEIWDLIIDYFHNDPKTLKECSLVSGSWAYLTQKRLFKDIRIKFRDEAQFLRWEEDFPDPSKSPACHAKFLYFSHTITRAHLGVMKSFTNVTHLEVSAQANFQYIPGSLDVLHNLSLPAVETLRVYSNSLHLSHLFALVGLSPSIKELAIVCFKIDDDWDNFPPSALPNFTGTLVLSCMEDNITAPLLLLPPNSLCPRKIVWRLNSLHDESRVRNMTDLIEKYSNTLEYVDFDFTTGVKISAATPPIDLSKATKLKGVASWLDEDQMEWFTKSLEKISPGKAGFEQILIRFQFFWSGPMSLYGKETIKQCISLDNLLVRLSEPEEIRVKAVDHTRGYQQDRARFLRCDLFPEMTRRGKWSVSNPSDSERDLAKRRYLSLSRYNESEKMG